MSRYIANTDPLPYARFGSSGGLDQVRPLKVHTKLGDCDHPASSTVCCEGTRWLSCGLACGGETRVEIDAGLVLDAAAAVPFFPEARS